MMFARRKYRRIIETLEERVSLLEDALQTELIKNSVDEIEPEFEDQFSNDESVKAPSDTFDDRRSLSRRMKFLRDDGMRVKDIAALHKLSETTVRRRIKEVENE